MESLENQDRTSGSAERGRSEVGIKKIRPRENTARVEELVSKIERPSRVFAAPITVNIPAGYSSVDFEVPHSLGVVPTDIIYGLRDDNVTVWRGGTPWTRSAIYLRSSGAASFAIYLVP